MTDILRPVLELSVIIPGILLAYLPVKNYLRQTPLKLTAWLLPLLLGICILGGAVCCALQIPTRWFLFPLLPVIMLIYHKKDKHVNVLRPFRGRGPRSGEGVYEAASFHDTLCGGDHRKGAVKLRRQPPPQPHRKKGWFG